MPSHRPDIPIASIRRNLLRWYRRNHRDLPWRKTADPYAIWVSEIMLQQTRVETVVPYFNRFLRQFPSARALAKAPLEKVLRAWQGLGYYTRARNLHAAARHVVAHCDGRLPSSVVGLRTLPGIGRYTAGAIASIAFGRDEPVVDGNVARVIARLPGLRGNVKSPAMQRRLWEIAGQLIPLGSAGDFNQALMELGAIICAPTNPRCADCPLRRLCRAIAKGRGPKRVNTGRRKAAPHYHVAVAAILKRGRILIGRRRPEGLLGGLWELPGGKIHPGESAPAAAVREVREELGIEVRALRELVTVRHAYSHFRVTIHAFACRHVAGRARPIGCDKCRWVGLADLGPYPFPAATLKILRALKRV